MDAAAVQRAFDLLLPHQHALAAAIAAIVLPGLMYVVGFRFQWRRDKREEGQSVAELMARLTKMQGEELTRLADETRALNQQVELLSNGRFRMQAMVEGLREQTIAARVLIHDYERRLGLAETTFPELPIPSFSTASSASQTSLKTS